MKNKNVFLNVHLMSENHLKILCGMTPERFWSLCDIIRRTGIMGRCPFISLPSLVLLWRMKLRQGASNGVLAGCFQVNDKTISSLFWLICLNYYEVSNQLPSSWASPEFTEELKNLQIESLRQNYDPFVMAVVSKFKDPSGENRLPFCLLFDR